MSMSVFLKNSIIDDYLRTDTVYVALFAGESEVSQGSYVRQPIEFVSPENGQSTNAEDVLFPVAEEVWGDITEVGIYDSQSGGNELFREEAEFTQTLDVSSQYRIPRNYMIVRLR